MRETVGSLRAYFIVAGILSGISALRALTHPLDPLLIVMMLAILLTSVGFIVAGVRLRSWLVIRRQWLTNLVWATMILQWIDALYSGLVIRAVPVAMAAMLVRPIVVALIGFYLLRSVKRLAAESVKLA